MPATPTWIPLRDLPNYSDKFRKWIVRQAQANPTLDLLKKEKRNYLVNLLELAKLNDQFLAAEKAKSEFEHLQDKVDDLENLLRVTNHANKLRIQALEGQINDLVAVTQELTGATTTSGTFRLVAKTLKYRGKIK